MTPENPTPSDQTAPTSPEPGLADGETLNTDDSVAQAVEHLPTELAEVRDADEQKAQEEAVAEMRAHLKSGNVSEVIGNIDSYIERCGQEAFLMAYLDTRGDEGLRYQRVAQMQRTGKFDPEISERLLTILPPGGTNERQRTRERMDSARTQAIRAVEGAPNGRAAIRTSSDKGSKFDPHPDEIHDRKLREDADAQWQQSWESIIGE